MSEDSGTTHSHPIAAVNSCKSFRFLSFILFCHRASSSKIPFEYVAWLWAAWCTTRRSNPDNRDTWIPFETITIEFYEKRCARCVEFGWATRFGARASIHHCQFDWQERAKTQWCLCAVVDIVQWIDAHRIVFGRRIRMDWAHRGTGSEAIFRISERECTSTASASCTGLSIYQWRTKGGMFCLECKLMLPYRSLNGNSIDIITNRWRCTTTKTMWGSIAYLTRKHPGSTPVSSVSHCIHLCWPSTTQILTHWAWVARAKSYRYVYHLVLSGSR